MRFVLFHSFIASLAPMVSHFWLSLFAITGLMTVFITHQPAQRGKCKGRSNSGGPCSLICQPCETPGQGLLMWFRWVSHAGVLQPSPLSAPATVPHYTPCHHQPYRQQALRFLTPGRPFFIQWHDGTGGEEEGKEGNWISPHTHISTFLPFLSQLKIIKSSIILLHLPRVLSTAPV